MKRNKNRMISFLLALVMIVGMIPASAFAVDGEGIFDVVHSENEQGVQTELEMEGETDPEADPETGSGEAPEVDSESKTEEEPEMDPEAEDGGGTETELDSETGAEDSSEEDDCNCNRTDGEHDGTCPEYTCPVCGRSDCWDPDCPGLACDICGEWNCLTVHVQCETCGKYETGDDPCICASIAPDDQGNSGLLGGTGTDENPGTDTENGEDNAPGDKDGNDEIEDEIDYSEHIGMNALFNPELVATDFIFVMKEDPDEGWIDDYFFPYEFSTDAVFRIQDYMILTEESSSATEEGSLEDLRSLWYQVRLHKGTGPEGFADGIWILQNYLGEDAEEKDILILSEPVKCEICGEFDCTVEHIRCETCGEYDCDGVHIYCEFCDKYNCGKDHLYCRACGRVDCTEDHVYCGYCNDYDCGIDHLEQNRPLEAPMIPENPTLTEGADVSIVDEDGDPVTGHGLYLAPGMKTSLSAWSEGESADTTYQWQIRYDEANDLWTDIRGQTGKGILFSPAMFLSVSEETDSAAIRCVMTSGTETMISETIPLSVVEPISFTGFQLRALGSEGDVQTAAEEDNTGPLTKMYVVIQYLYDDNRTAAATTTLELSAGAAHKDEHELPNIQGYVPELQVHSYDPDEEGRAQIVEKTEGGKTVKYLALDFDAGELTEEYTIFTITYQPTFVDVTVDHYWQNVENDDYTKQESDLVKMRFKTGDQVKEVENIYPGFYSLLYETPAAAADGSTVIEIYYDRYYYLMRFDLGSGAYGVDPIYVRYDDDIEVGEPTRVGYIFQGWDLAVTDSNGDGVLDTGDGVYDVPPDKMPAGNRTYIAQWKTESSAKVSVVFWGENPNDEGYSYLTTGVVYREPGTEYSYNNDNTVFLVCGKDAHTHTDACSVCGKVEHTQHTNECLSCTVTPHTHGTTCYPNVGNAFNGGWGESVQGNTTNGYIGQSYNWWGQETGTRYIYINGTWYRYTGSVAIGDPVATICGKVENSHVHGDSCYKCEYHEHTDSCYSCGLTEHTHSNTCNQTGSGLDSDLWTFKSSEKRTVEPDGTTVINVYYERVEFSVSFYSGSNLKNEYTDYRITAKWGASILDKWPEHNGSTSWYVQDKNNTWQNSIQIMPVGGAKFWGPKTGNNAYNAYYYVEALPGDTDTFEYNNVTYKLHHIDTSASSGNVTDEEKYDIEGFTYKEGTANGQSYNNAKFYYVRHRYNLEFYNPTSLIRKTEGVTFESNLGSYDWMPTSADAPAIYEPGTVEFAGWHLNPECDGEPYVLGDHTMPSADENGATALVLYAKWEPIEHTVRYYLNIESLEAGETIPVEMARRYAEANNGAAIPEGNPYTDELFQDHTVKHGAYVPQPPDPEVAEGYENIHPFTGMDFIGWFYLDDDGEEAAFDPKNMTVNRNLNLYGKWSANTLCEYNVYFALDVKNNDTGAEGADGKADVDEKGNIIYVAEPFSGSGLAGRTYTFTAKGGEDLYSGYQEGHFPVVGSHSITINVADVDGTGANSYIFLYQQKAAVPYTVKYLEKGTEKVLSDKKYVADNKNAVVTENYVYITGYMVDEYQKTLVVTDDGDETNDVIIFYYTEDTVNALYVANYYIQNLTAGLDHKGWSKYDDLQNVAKIGETITAEARDIPGFTLSKDYTDLYNVTEKKNGMDGTALPGVVGELTDGTLTGKLPEEGLQLNFYYTRNTYSYEFRYWLSGTTRELADSVTGKSGYGMVVSESADEVLMRDLDGDGIEEEYRLEDPSRDKLDITIKESGNVKTFYYIRSTQDLSVTKTVEGVGADPDQEFRFQLKINAKEYHQNKYSYEKSGGATGTLDRLVSEPNTLQFALKAGQTITIDGLPTGTYTLTELELPEGYTHVSGANASYTLTSGEKLAIPVVNRYTPPADLTITRTNAEPDQVFVYRVTGGDGLSIDVTMVTDEDGKGSVTIANLPYGTYTVTQLNDWSWRYDDGAKTVNHFSEDGTTVSFEKEIAVTQWLSSPTVVSGAELANFWKNIFGGA